MLKFLQIILSIIVLLLAGYGLITQDFKFQPYMMLFFSLTMLVIGLREYKQGKKGSGRFIIIVFIFMFYVSIRGFLMK